MIKCNCFQFDKKKFKLEVFLEKLETIASTNWREGMICNDEIFTKLLQCRDCNDYFLWDKQKGNFSLNDRVGIRRYETGLEKNDMKIIFKHLGKGVASQDSLDYFVKSTKYIKRNR